MECLSPVCAVQLYTHATEDSRGARSDGRPEPTRRRRRPEWSEPMTQRSLGLGTMPMEFELARPPGGMATGHSVIVTAG